MPKFIVHLFPVVRVKLLQEIEAATYEEAVSKCQERLNLHDILDGGDHHTLDIEWSEDTPYANVDVVGDPEYLKSRWVHLEVGSSVGCKIYPSFRALVEWARKLCEHFGAPPQVVCDASDELVEVDQDLAAQRKGPA